MAVYLSFGRLTKICIQVLASCKQRKLKWEKGKKKKVPISSGNIHIFGDFFIIFSLSLKQYRFLQRQTAALLVCSCQTYRNSGLSSLPFRLSGGIRYSSATPPLVQRVKKNHSARNSWCEFLVPRLGSWDSAESLRIICMEMDRRKQLAEISKTWRFRILSQTLTHVRIPGRASFSLVLTLSFRRIQSPTQDAEIVHD